MQWLGADAASGTLRPEEANGKIIAILQRYPQRADPRPVFLDLTYQPLQSPQIYMGGPPLAPTFCRPLSGLPINWLFNGIPIKYPPMRRIYPILQITTSSLWENNLINKEFKAFGKY